MLLSCVFICRGRFGVGVFDIGFGDGCQKLIQVEVTYWDEGKFNQRIFTDEGNDEMAQTAAAAASGNGA